MNPYFCVMPFFGEEIGLPNHKTTPCCLLKNNSNIDEVRQKILQQQRPDECSACWNLEQQNIKSDRQYKNEAFDLYLNKDIRFIEEDCKKNLYSKQIIKVYTSNLCNSTCVTCSPDFSSAWASLKKINKKKASVSFTDLSHINYNDIKMLSFVGGEPLYEKKNFDILNKLIEADNTNCFVSIVSNGSVGLSSYQLEILKKFQNLNICLSIDGIASKFEYIRYPLKWHMLLKNIELFRSLGVKLSVSYTISNLNLMYYNETVNWFNEQNLSYNHNIVNYPLHFSINSLPEEIKRGLSPEAKLLLREHLPHDDNQFISFINEINFQDRLKNISIKNYMPEIYDLIQKNI